MHWLGIWIGSMHKSVPTANLPGTKAIKRDKSNVESIDYQFFYSTCDLN